MSEHASASAYAAAFCQALIYITFVIM